jgi:hypothetical protein
MSISFFLNVAVGAGLGPTAVAVAAHLVFGQALGAAIAFVAAAGYALAVLTLGGFWIAGRAGRRRTD